MPNTDQQGQESLLDNHSELMQAYSFMLKHTIFPSYSFWLEGVFPAFEKMNKRLGAAKELFALVGMSLSLFFITDVYALLTNALSKLDTYFPTAVQTRISKSALPFIEYGMTIAMVIVLTVMLLNYWLVKPGDAIPWLIRPVVVRSASVFIRQHIHAQLHALLSLYRAQISKRTLCPEQQSQLIEIAEQTGKFKDSLPPKLQIWKESKIQQQFQVY